MIIKTVIITHAAFSRTMLKNHGIAAIHAANPIPMAAKSTPRHDFSGLHTLNNIIYAENAYMIHVIVVKEP